MKAFFTTFLVTFSVLTLALIAGLEWAASQADRASRPLTPADRVDPVLPPRNLMLVDRAPAVERAIEAARAAKTKADAEKLTAPPRAKDDLLERVEAAIVQKLVTP